MCAFDKAIVVFSFLNHLCLEKSKKLNPNKAELWIDLKATKMSNISLLIMFICIYYFICLHTVVRFALCGYLHQIISKHKRDALLPVQPGVLPTGIHVSATTTT